MWRHRNIFPQKGNPKPRAQREESPGPIQEIRAGTHRTQARIPGHLCAQLASKQDGTERF